MDTALKPIRAKRFPLLVWKFLVAELILDSLKIIATLIRMKVLYTGKDKLKHNHETKMQKIDESGELSREWKKGNAKHEMD